MLATRVDGVILDAPAASFGDVLDEAAEFRSLPVAGLDIPESLEDVAKLFVAWRYGVDYKAVDYTDKDGLIKVPLLTLQGSADETVPAAHAERLFAVAAEPRQLKMLAGGLHRLRLDERATKLILEWLVNEWKD